MIESTCADEQQQQPLKPTLLERSRQLKLRIMNSGCWCNNNDFDDQSKRESKQIDKDIKKWHQKYSNVIKLLLIGPGESGKTTIIKQMKILHIQGFSNEDRQEKAKEIKENVFDAIKELTSNLAYLKPPVELRNADNQKSLEFISKLDHASMGSYNFPDEFFDHVKSLWNDEGIQECYLRANEFFLIDSAKYFLDKIDEIRNVNYLPSDQDILRSRKRTCDIQKIEFEVKVPKQFGGGSQGFNMFDVGGQSGERRKWIQVFDGITAVVFVVDCSGFDSKVRENEKKNRLVESLEVFQTVWCSKYLQNSGFILFLNKQDILKEKIDRGSKIENYFPEYKDYKVTSKKVNPKDSEAEYNKARYFIRDKFLEIVNENPSRLKDRGSSRECFCHFTTATDTNNIKRVFNDVHTMILNKNLDCIV